jgi:tetratricopeptide (TPR) repeat protein
MGYRFYTSRPTYLTDKGVEALGRGNVALANQFADRLQRKGYDSAARILRGKIFLDQAKELLERAPRPFPYEGVQRASQMVMSGAGLSAQPFGLRGPYWLALVQVQKSSRRQISGMDELLDAVGEFTQVLDGDPWATEATVLTSECLFRLGDYRSAEQALRSLVDRQPDNLNAHRWLAAIYVELSAGPLAAAHLREWIRLDAKDPRPFHWLRLITRYTNGGYTEVIQAYRKSLELGLNPDEQAAVLQEMATIQIAKLADYQRALETLAEAPKAYQDQHSFRLLRADCLLGLGKGEEAKRIVDDVLNENPAQTGALLFRAKLFILDDQPQSAIPLMEKLLSLHPNNTRARQTMMLAYRSIRDDRRAAEQKEFLDTLLAPRERLLKLQKAVDHDPWNGRARLEMAMLNSGTDHSEALAWIRSALASTPDDPMVRKTWTQLVGYRPPPLLRDYQRRRQGKTNVE